MKSKLQTWEREQYVAGGGDPFLFYVVYGDVNLSAPFSRGTYRSNGAPNGIEIMTYGGNKHSEVPGSFREGYLWDELVSKFPELATTVEQCNRCIVLRGTPADSTNLDYLRDTIGFITYLIEHGDCAVYDPRILRWWQPSDWNQQLFDPAASVPRHQTVILVSEERNSSLKWFHTRGMRKFGRPDISVRNVPRELEGGVIDLCNRLIEHQAFGQVVRDGQDVRMASLPSGGVIHHAGELDDPDFNKVHLDVRLENATQRNL